MEAGELWCLLFFAIAVLSPSASAQQCSGSCLGDMIGCSPGEMRTCDSWTIPQDVFCYGFPLESYDPCEDLGQCVEETVYIYKATVGNSSCQLPVSAFEIPTSKCLYGYNGLFKDQLDASCYEAAQSLSDYIDCKNSIHGAATDVYFTLEDINESYGDVAKYTTSDCQGVPFDTGEIQFRHECRMNLTEEYIYAFIGITNDCYLQDFANIAVTSTSATSTGTATASNSATEVITKLSI